MSSAAASNAPVFLKSLGQTPFAQAILESSWIFPTVETLHVLALALVFGSIAIVDLRLLGLFWRERSVASLADQTLRWTWSAFGLAVVTGTLLALSNPVKYYDNVPFRIKLLLLGLAGLNMLVFQLRYWPQVRPLPAEAVLPPAARWAGALSLTFWVGVVTAGRWIAFVGY